MNGAAPDSPGASPDDDRARVAAEAQAERQNEAAAEAEARAKAAGEGQQPAAEAAEPEGPKLSLEDVAKIAAGLIDLAARNFLGDEVAATKGEKELIAQTAQPVLEKWFPKFLGELEPEWALVGVVGIIYGSKVIMGPSSSSSSKPAQPPSSPAPAAEKTVQGEATIVQRRPAA